MSKIDIVEIEAINDLNFAGNSQEAQTSTDKDIKDVITNFSNAVEHGQLSGDPYKIAEQKFQSFQVSFGLKSEAGEALSSGISEALGKLNEYLDGDESIDESNLEPFQHEVERLKALNMALESDASNTWADEYGWYKGTDGEQHYGIVGRYRPDRYYELLKEIAENNENIEKYNKKIEKIKGLPGIYEIALAALEPAAAKIDAFANSIGNA